MLNYHTEDINSFTYKGKNSADMGLIITKKESNFGRPAPKVETIEIPGRAPLIMNAKADPLDNDDFENYTRTYICHALPEEGQDLEQMARNIYIWLFGDSAAYKRLEDTYERDFFRMAYLAEEMSLADMAAGLIGKLQISFECKAWKYAKEGQRAITLTAPGTIYNLYGFTAKPYIKITGSGNVTLYVNNRAHTFKDISGYIEIDSDLMSAYKGSLPQNNKMVSQLFPKLTAGENEITWNGNVSSIEIIPRWCCL